MPVKTRGSVQSSDHRRSASRNTRIVARASAPVRSVGQCPIRSVRSYLNSNTYGSVAAYLPDDPVEGGGAKYCSTRNS